MAVHRFDGFFNRWYIDPILRGRYPEDMLELLAPLGVPIEEGDLARIHEPLDFVGLNNYTRMFVRAEPGPGLAAAIAGKHRVPGARYTTMGWEIYPEGLFELLMRFRTEYDNPRIYITENGGAFADVVEGGAVHDDERAELLRAYIASMARAIQAGARVEGYFVWSLLDNFEWAHGYDKRFGLIHVDYATGRRTPKDSAHWYRDFITAARKQAASRSPRA
jgi:beta-glucosidase